MSLTQEKSVVTLHDSPMPGVPYFALGFKIYHRHFIISCSFFSTAEVTLFLSKWDIEHRWWNKVFSIVGILIGASVTTVSPHKLKLPSLEFHLPECITHITFDAFCHNFSQSDDLPHSLSHFWRALQSTSWSPATIVHYHLSTATWPHNAKFNHAVDRSPSLVGNKFPEFETFNHPVGTSFEHFISCFPRHWPPHPAHLGRSLKKFLKIFVWSCKIWSACAASSQTVTRNNVSIDDGVRQTWFRSMRWFCFLVKFVMAI